MKAVTVEISLKALRLLLKLPANTVLTKVRQNWEQEHMGRFEVLVEAPNLPETFEGNTIPWGSIICHSEFCRQDEISHIISSEVQY